MSEKIDEIIGKAVKGNKKLTEYERGYFDGWHEATFKELKEIKKNES